jgi:GTP-binding protein
MVETTLKAVSRRPAAFPRVLATSAETGFGMAELRAEVAAAALPAA